MIIENPDALKQWLTGYLPPLCDADPEVLAKYCLALVRKDRPNSELKASMLEQLDVFLKTNTEGFVEKFLEVAKNKSYLPKEVSSSHSSVTPASGFSAAIAALQVSGHSPDSTTNSGTTPSSISSSVPSTSTTTSITISDSISQPPLPPLPPPSIPIPHPPPETTPPYPPPPVIAKKEEVSSSVKSRKSELDRDKEDRRGHTKARSRGRSRSRSRSRDRERNHRSRSRGRSTRSKYDDRRRRSPHVKRYRRSRSRSRSRSPRWSRSPVRRSRSRDRRSRSRNRSLSPRGRKRSSSPKRISNRHRTRSRSPIVHAKSGSLSPASPACNEKEDSPSSDVVGGSVPSAIVHSVVSIPNTQEHFTASKSQRCRDYDEQGFCMRGDQCPYDHGTDPVVLEGGALDFSPPLSGVSNVRYQSGHGPSVSLQQDIATRNMLRHPPPSVPPRQSHFEYTPNNPSLWPGDNLSNPPPFFGRGRGVASQPPRFPVPPVPGMGRSLIDVPVGGLEHAKRLGNPSLRMPGSGPNPHRYAHPSSENLTLEVRKIPINHNTILHLNQHFSKFGTITNIQVHHEGDPEAALVTFSRGIEATAAYRSTEAVLNNRFIKIYWHYPLSKANPSSNPVSSITATQRALHERLGMRHPPKSMMSYKVVSADSSLPDKGEKVFVSKGSLVKTVYNPSAMKIPRKELDHLKQIIEGKQAPIPAAADSTQQKHQRDQTPQSEEPLSENPPLHPPTTQRQFSAEEIKQKEREAIEKQQELLRAQIAAKQKAEKQKADALKLKHEVEKRTKQLLDKQMQQVKVLLNKLETNKDAMKPEEKLTLMKTIKSLQAAIDTTKAQLVPTVPLHPKINPKIVTKEGLDTELDGYNTQPEVGDSTHFKSAQFNTLKSQPTQIRPRNAYSLSNIPNQHPAKLSSPSFTMGRGHTSHPISRGTFKRGRGRGYGASFNMVDRRTTSLNASGFEREDKEDVLAHFSSFGTVSKYHWDSQTPAITLTYSNRKEAEKAMTEARNLGDRLLTLTWTPDPPASHKELPTKGSSSPTVNSPHNSPPTQTPTTVSFGGPTTPHSTVTLASNEEVEEITEEIVEVEESVEGEEDALLFDDEVDEEEDEGRSWRR